MFECLVPISILSIDDSSPQPTLESAFIAESSAQTTQKGMDQVAGLGRFEPVWGRIQQTIGSFDSNVLKAALLLEPYRWSRRDYAPLRFLKTMKSPATMAAAPPSPIAR